MASGRSGGYILSKRPPPSPDKSHVGGFKQRRTEGLTAEGANLITGAQRDVGPLEDWDHAGSGGRYMAHKNRKLHEQFAEVAARERAGWVPQKEEDAALFQGVSIFVNGLTDPSQLELKQIMALHGGRFVNYYTRDTVTHIICSNLTDAKVKIFERERHPKPVVRPEWIVDSLKAHKVLPHEGYVLQRLRAQPGQKLLAGYQPASGLGSFTKDSLFPQARVRGDDPGRAADLASQPPVTDSRSAADLEKPAVPEPRATPQTAAAAAIVAEPDVQSSRAEHAFGAVQPAVDGSHIGMLPTETGANPAQQPHSAHQALTPELHQLDASVSAPQADQSNDGFELSLQLPADEERAAAPQALPGPSAAEVAAAACEPSLQQEQQPICPGPQDTRRLPRADEAPPALIADDTDLAQQVAAQKRGACDVLKGPPRSSRDDPEFMNTFFKASRLHFIGTWKARIDALMAAPPESTPHPVSLQPSVAAALQGQRRATERAIIHLDMDCFFASIAVQGHPSFRGKPLCVCHSNSAVGSAEVSSANYEARDFGVHAGMSMSRAKQRCPHLLVLPYEFDKYEEASEAVYKILLKHTTAVQPISCDEAYLDVTGLSDPFQIAAAIRAEVETATGCTASAGIGPNMLLARLATKRAKPNGVFRYLANEAEAAIAALPLKDLPGVGWSLQQRLGELGLSTAADVRMATKERLQRELGEKTGENLWLMAHGRDLRLVQPPKPRKSLGAEVNWGIRFRNQQDADVFLLKLSGEVANRLVEAGVKGRSVTLKLKRRKEGAPEPYKFLGHGICDSLSRSLTLSRFIDSAAEIAAEAQGLMRALRVPPEDMRGVGITVTRLSNDPASGAAKPTSTAPAKGIAPPASVFDPTVPHPWAAEMLQQVAKERDQAARGAADAPQFPERPWVDGPADSLAPARSPADDSPAKHARPAISGPLDRQFGAQPKPLRVAEQAAAAAAGVNIPTSEAEGPAEEHSEPLEPGVSNDFTFDVVGPQSSPQARNIGEAPLPSFLQRAMAAAAPHVADPVVHAAAHEKAAGCEQTAAAEGAEAYVKAEPEEPLPTAPTQDSPIKPLPPKPGNIVALPPASQLDQSVLDSLPLVTRRELEMAYGINTRRKPTPRQTKVTAEPRPQPRLRAAAPAPVTAYRLPPAAAQVDEDILAALPDDLQAEVRQGLVALGGRHVQQEGFATDEDERSGDAWDAGQWLAHDAETVVLDSGGGRSLALPADVQAAAPQSVLDFLCDCSASDGCELLADWAAAGLPGLEPPTNLHSNSATAAAGNTCGCLMTGEVQLCTKHAAWRSLCQAWAGSFADADLEALRQVVRCIAQLGQHHAELRPASTAAVTAMQRQMMELHGSQLRLEGVFD